MTKLNNKYDHEKKLEIFHNNRNLLKKIEVITKK